MASTAVVPNGHKVKSLRREKGWTQEKLAEKAGCSKRTIENTEKNMPVLPRILSEIGQALGVEAKSLLATDPGYALSQSNNPRDSEATSLLTKFKETWFPAITDNNSAWAGEQRKQLANDLLSLSRELQKCKAAYRRREEAALLNGCVASPDSDNMDTVNASDDGEMDEFSQGVGSVIVALRRVRDVIAIYCPGVLNKINGVLLIDEAQACAHFYIFQMLIEQLKSEGVVLDPPALPVERPNVLITGPEGVDKSKLRGLIKTLGASQKPMLVGSSEDMKLVPLTVTFDSVLEGLHGFIRDTFQPEEMHQPQGQRA